jgi:hypothetical protein
MHACFLSLVLLGSALVVAGPVIFTSFPAGTLPETIVQAPNGFGSFDSGYCRTGVGARSPAPSEPLKRDRS